MIDWTPTLRLGDLPSLAAAAWGDQPAQKYKGRWESFADIDREVDRVARGLIASGVLPGDKVAVWLNNCPEWVYLMFALAKIGVVQVPVNTRFRTSDSEYIIGQSDCTTLITHDISGPIDYLEMVRELIPTLGEEDDITSEKFPNLSRVIVKPSAPDSTGHAGVLDWRDVLAAADDVPESELTARAEAVDPANTVFIMYTSGTTGFPKGVMRHHGFLRNEQDRLMTLGTTEADIMFNYLPLFHIMGYVDGPVMMMMAGNRMILAETFDPEETLDAVETDGVTMVAGFETHLKGLMDAQERKPRDIQTLRSGLLAGGMYSAVPVFQKALEVLHPLVPITAYGMTEIGANASLSELTSSPEQICETSGQPCPGFEIRVIDPETGKDRPARTPGEIVVKTYNIMQGYYKKPDETAAAFTEDGWLLSGDMGYLREDGYLRFLGRYKDMLKIGGENVDPMEVEGYLLGHPGIKLAAVVGYPDRRLTEVGVAFVVRWPESDVEAGELLETCRGRIASFKIPRHVIFTDDLPMTSTGKIQKAKLRERALDELAR